MKNGFPNLKNIYFPSPTGGQRARSVNKNSETPKFELSSSVDLTTNSFTPAKQDSNILKEISMIDKKLDSKEIELKNTKLSECINLEIELKNYINYLSEISLCVKQKDSKLSKSLLRGIIGCERVANKILSRLNFFNAQKLLVAKILKTDNGSQTDHYKYEEPVLKFCSTPELESIKQLGSTLKKFKVSCLTGQLNELYDSLSRMYTDIPEATASPEPPDLEMSTPANIMNMHLKVIKKNLSNFLSANKLDSLKSFEAKACQDDFPSFPTTQSRVLETTVQEKELELKKTKKKYQAVAEEKKTMENTIKKMKTFYAEVEKRHNEIEIEAVKLKSKNSHSESLIEAQAKKIKFLEQKLEKKTKKLHKAKLRIEELKGIIIKKQEHLHKISNELFDITIKFRINEEKLFQIEKAWERKIGKKFEQREVDYQTIINRYKIEKDCLDEETFAKLKDEIQSDISANEYPDADSFITFEKSHEEILNIENFEKRSAERKKSFPNPSTENMTFQEQFKSKKETQRSEEESEESEEEVYHVNKKEKRLRRLKSGRKLESEEESEEESDTEDRDPRKKKGRRKSKKKSKPKSKRNSESVSEKQSIRSTSRKPTRTESIQSSETVEQRYIPPSPSNNVPLKNLFSQQSSLKLQPKSPQFLDVPIPLSKTMPEQVPLYSNLIEFQYDFDNEEVEELKKKEEEIRINLERAESSFLGALNEEGKTLYDRYNNLTNELNDIKALLNLKMKSIGIQCIFDRGEALITKSAEHMSGIDTKYMRKFVDGKSIYDPLDELKNNMEAQKILTTMFDNQTQIEMLSLKDKQEIVNSLKGHQVDKCKDLCPHLLRVLKIKWRVRNTPYPIKKIVLKY